MRADFLCRMLLVMSLFGFAAAKEKDASVNEVVLRVKEASHSGAIVMELANRSGKPIRIWKDSNSWGAARWRVLLLRKGKLETFFQNPDEDFTVNIPEYYEIAGGAHIDVALDLNGGNWCGLSHCSSFNERGFAGRTITFEPKDLIIVVYDVPFTPESLRMGVWYGVAATSATVK